MATSPDGSPSAATTTAATDSTPPSGPDTTGLRPRAPRAQLVHAVMCKFADETAFTEVTCVNISQSGMLVSGAAHVAVGSRVDFKFFLETGFEILSGVGTVARHAPPQPGRSDATLGIAFFDMNPAQVRILGRVVELNSVERPTSPGW